MEDECNSESDSKDVAFYTATVQAWVTTRMEKDRTTLNLSAAGIGLLVTLLTTVGPSSHSELLLYGLAGTCYASAIVVALLVFDRNSHYLEEVIKSRKDDDDATLIKLDRGMFWLFIAGVVLTGVLGMFTGYNRVQRDTPMAQENQQTTARDRYSRGEKS